ncbi:MAG TPA: hypothetical protein VNQ99_10670 [Xanthobacteraceae bacterium]|nr:hypothetical protein [Xanthobacteraceae bacterium]
MAKNLKRIVTPVQNVIRCFDPETPLSGGRTRQPPRSGAKSVSKYGVFVPEDAAHIRIGAPVPIPLMFSPRNFRRHRDVDDSPERRTI